MTKVEVKVINNSRNELPSYKTPEAAGADICADIPEGEIIVLHPGERVIVPTGLKIELPYGYECQIRSRSGLAINQGVVVLNSPGCVDADYRGEIKVIIANLGNRYFEIHNGDRIAQMIIAPVRQAVFTEVDELSETERADGGFGHTGVK